jgi:hypothetical protein
MFLSLALVCRTRLTHLTVWAVQAAEEKKKATQASLTDAMKMAEEAKARKEALRREAGLPVDTA